MKGFIKITRLNGDISLVNVSKILLVKPSPDGCVISLEDIFLPKGLKGSFNQSNHLNNIDISYKYENMSLTAKEGFEEVCALIEDAQS